MKTQFLVLLSIFSLVSCSRNEEPKNESVVIGNKIDVLIQNANGQDLLNKSTANTLNTDNIKLYYLVDGNPQEVYIPNSTNPKNYYIFNYEVYNSNAIRIFLNDQSKDEYPIAYIKWNQSDTDTIKCHFYRDNGIVTIDKVWYNDRFVYPTVENQNIGSIIKLIK